MKTTAIARNTFSEAVRQPVLYVILFVGIALLLLSFAFTLFTFSEENTAKMIKDMGIATITLCALLVALFTASGVIADEIDKKTALTVLCKPVTRVQFLIGKYIGIIFTVICVVVIQVLIFVIALWLLERKIAYVVMQASVFSFLQVAVLTAVSVAISTRYPLVVNVSVCFVLYVAGHISSFIWPLFSEKGPILRTCAHIFAILLPNLETLNASAAAASGTTISISCLAFACLYAVSYIVAVLAIAFIAFEHKELM